MRSLSIVLGALIAASCNGPANGNAGVPVEPAESNAAPALANASNAASAAVATETVGQDGAHWMYGTNDAKEPYAMYGPENAEAYVILECGARGLNVSMPNVDAHPARARAIVISGSNRFEAPTTIEGEEISTLSFAVPDGTPVLSTMPTSGLVIAFRNGERNSFPASPLVARLITGCRTRQAAGVVPTVNFAGSYSTDANSIEITATGPNSYKLALSYMYEMVTGNFRTDEIEREGSAKGNVLTLTPYDPSDKPCRLSQIGTSNQYRMSGCDEPIDGVYTRK